ncbi:MAG: hypothetical protein ACFFDI_26905 [Promethearchaeota archaeon]
MVEEREGSCQTSAGNRIVYGRYRTHYPSRFTNNLNGPFTLRRTGGL